MKKFGFWAVAAALLLAPMGFCSCSMGSTTTSEMREDWTMCRMI